MNWQKLGPKEPDFNERVLFIDKDDNWWDGTLQEMKQTANGKEYIVTIGYEGHTFHNPTHFMRITTPKE